MDKNKKNANTEDAEKSTENTEAVKKDSVGPVGNSEGSVIQELENQVKRTLADYRNLENRIQNERGEWILKANKQLLLNILPVLDTLMLASKHSKDQSLVLSLQQFLDILKKEGVTKIDALGKDFDPALMEGIGEVEVDPSAGHSTVSSDRIGSGQEGKVIQEARPGYMLYDKVLRPAQVIVGGSK